MRTTRYQFRELFAQLGLPDDEQSIAHFLTIHTAMANGHRLPDAPYWKPSQTAFLKESLIEDSDWCDLVDQLSRALRTPVKSG